MNTNFSKLRKETIQNYLCSTKIESISNLIPSEATDIEVSNLSKFEMTVNKVYRFTITYTANSTKQTREVILKLYTDEKRRHKEHEILKFLRDFNFPVPKVYITEFNPEFFGHPFIIMERIKGKPIRTYINHLSSEKILCLIDKIAKTLANLHDLKLDGIDIGLRDIDTKNKYAYAEKQVLWKNELPDYVNKHGFEWATRWLKHNAQKVPCDHYSLVRRDMNLNNFLVTDQEEIFIVDWEWTEIGDPLIDVGYAYHNIRHAFGVKHINGKGAKFASYFIKKYFEHSKRKINPFSLKYYLFCSGLREAVYLRYKKAQTTSLAFIKSYGLKYLPFILYVWFHYRSRFKHLERYLRDIAIDYEDAMFRTLGGIILSRMEIEDILKFLDAKPRELILDVGVGSGRISREIISRAKSNVIAIDVERDAVYSAKMKQNIKYEVLVADGQHLPFKNNCFDGIVCIRTLKYFKNPLLGISEMTRVLKAGGRLVVDFSSNCGYEVLLRHLKPVPNAKRAHVFNFYEIRNLLKNYKLDVIMSTSLQKIPQNFWNLFSNLNMLKLLVITEGLLSKIPPKVLCRSILTKCTKES